MYVTVGKADVAVTMYKKLKMYNDMIRLVKQFFKEHLEATHAQLAKVFSANSMLDKLFVELYAR